jgi:hypothetical protein
MLPHIIKNIHRYAYFYNQLTQNLIQFLTGWNFGERHPRASGFLDAGDILNVAQYPIIDYNK